MELVSFAQFIFRFVGLFPWYAVLNNDSSMELTCFEDLDIIVEVRDVTYFKHKRIVGVVVESVVMRATVIVRSWNFGFPYSEN